MVRDAETAGPAGTAGPAARETTPPGPAPSVAPALPSGDGFASPGGNAAEALPPPSGDGSLSFAASRRAVAPAPVIPPPAGCAATARRGGDSFPATRTGRSRG